MHISGGKGGAPTGLDDVKVLGVDVAMLGEVEVLLCDENALCGDRVSACPYVQQSREIVQVCHSHGSRGRILTSEEVPGVLKLAYGHLRCMRMEGSSEAQAQDWILRANVHFSVAPHM